MQRSLPNVYSKIYRENFKRIGEGRGGETLGRLLGKLFGIFGNFSLIFSEIPFGKFIRISCQQKIF